MILTKQQRLALKRIYERDTTVTPTYRDFRRSALPGSNCIMVHWKGMWLGIEHDGYTHS